MANIKFYRKSTRPTNIAEGSLWFDSSKNRIILAGASSSADVVYGSYLNNCSASNGTLTITKIDGTSVSFTNTDTKVTSVDNHYTPTENTASQLNAMATNGTATWSQDVVTAVSLKRDAKGHVTGLSVSSGKIPANPNTDTKVTSVANHYTPSGGTETSGSFITGITKDAAGHVTKVTTRGALAASDIPNISADKITSGTISIDRLPKGALERLFVVDTESAAMSADVQEGDTVKVTGNSNKMYFCVKDPKATGATFATCFTEYTAGSATSVPWSGVTGKPDSYPIADNSVTTAKVKSGSITKDKLDSSIQSQLNKSDSSVLYTNQSLTDARQLQARKNIGTLSGVTVDLDKLEGVFDDSYTVLEFLQGSDNTAKNKAVCDYIMAQLPSNQTALQILCTRADYPAFELRMTITDDDGAKETVSIFPRLYMVSDTGFAICLLPMSLYSNFLIKDLIPGVEGYIEYVRDYFMATPTNTMPELFICYNCNDGSVIMITPSGAARFQMFKPLYLSEFARDAGAEYSDADKARGRKILNVPDSASLATSFKAVTIYTDNTTEHKAANVANIKAYCDNLKSIGVDIDNVGFFIPCVFKYGIDCYGALMSYNVSDVGRFIIGIVGGTSGDSFLRFVRVDASGGVENRLDIINDESLTTTSKSILGAINEINALAKSKASTAVATTSANGLMSSADKIKLEGIASNATNVTATTVSGWGFTKNTGTVTAVKINGTTKNPTSGVVDLGTFTIDEALTTDEIDKIFV